MGDQLCSVQIGLLYRAQIHAVRHIYIYSGCKHIINTHIYRHSHRDKDIQCLSNDNIVCEMRNRQIKTHPSTTLFSSL